MTSKEITELPIGTKVFLIQNAEIQAWETIGFHPKHKQYFYLAGNGSISKTKCLFLDGKVHCSDMNLHWETDYAMATEVMWEQFKQVAKVKNDIFMKGKKSVNFDEDQRNAILRAIMKRYGGFVPMRDAIRDDYDTVVVNLMHDVWEDTGEEPTEAEIDSVIKDALG